MKAIKKLLCILLAVTLACGSGFMTDCRKAEAAYKVYAPNDVRCGVGKRYCRTVTVDLVSASDTIKNIKKKFHLADTALPGTLRLTGKNLCGQRLNLTLHTQTAMPRTLITTNIP